MSSQQSWQFLVALEASGGFYNDHILCIYETVSRRVIVSSTSHLRPQQCFQLTSRWSVETPHRAHRPHWMR